MHWKFDWLMMYLAETSNEEKYVNLDLTDVDQIQFVITWRIDSWPWGDIEEEGQKD